MESPKIARSNANSLTVAVLQKRNEVFSRNSKYITELRCSYLSSVWHSLSQCVQELPHGCRAKESVDGHRNRLLLLFQHPEQSKGIGTIDPGELVHRLRPSSGLFQRRSKLLQPIRVTFISGGSESGARQNIGVYHDLALGFQLGHDLINEL